MAADAEKALTRYLRGEVAAHSPYYRRLSEEGGDGGWAGGVDDLSRLPLLRLGEVEAPADFVLRPDWASLGRAGHRDLAGSRSGRRRRRGAGELVDHRYKPVHWTLDDGVPVGSSAADMERLAGLGARWLALAGVEPTDVLVGLALPGPNLTFWELVVGAREAGVSAIHLPPAAAAAEVVRLCPTVLAGRPFDLARLLASARAEGGPLASVHTLLALGEPLEDGMRAKLLQLLESPEQGAVVAAWAPPGVRSLWSECRSAGVGEAAAATGTVGGTGLHTWPEAEVLEVIDPLSGTSAPPGADGEVVWTALGWSGTVFVRLRTGVFATLDDGPCPACHGPGPRLSIVSDTPAFLTALDRHPEVTGWQAELRTVEGREELIVFMSLAPAVAARSVMPELDDQLSATQYVVVDGPTLDARLAAHDDRRVVDLRRR
ncbi:MAG TPA: hypothetical protein VM142_05355 [Acidimicrobiales bacterium]|nr:hypothetical protein [Acidimicrobiales bacterium]